MSIPETGLRIRYYGDPVLRRRSGPVDKITDSDRDVIREMLEVMRMSGGIGLAAPQVGLARQIILVDIGQGPLVLINPKIEAKSGSEVMEEGCLSLPGVHVKVRRAKKVTVSGLNEKNEKAVLTAADLMARALQHEIDHLRGRLIIDYANFIERPKLRRELKSFLSQAAAPCGVQVTEGAKR